MPTLKSQRAPIFKRHHGNDIAVPRAWNLIMPDVGTKFDLFTERPLPKQYKPYFSNEHWCRLSENAVNANAHIFGSSLENETILVL